MPKLDLIAATRIKTVGGELAKLKGAGFTWVKPSVGPTYHQITSLGLAMQNFSDGNNWAVAPAAGVLVLGVGCRRQGTATISYSTLAMLLAGVADGSSFATGYGYAFGDGATTYFEAMPGTTGSTQRRTATAQFSMGGGSVLEVAGATSTTQLNGGQVTTIDSGSALPALAVAFTSWHTSNSITAHTFTAGWTEHVARSYSDGGPFVGIYTKELPVGGSTTFTITKTGGGGNFQMRVSAGALRSKTP